MTRLNPLLLPFLALAAGIGASRLAFFEVWEVLVAGGFLAALSIAAMRLGSARAANLAALAAVALGGVAVDGLHRSKAAPVIDREPYESLLFTGCVVEPPATFRGRSRFVVELDRGARARVNLYLNPGQAGPILEYGTLVEFEGRAREPRNFGNPGAFDYAGYLARREIYWNISVSPNATVRPLPGTCGSQFRAAVFAVREWALNRIGALFAGDAFADSMSRAILLGDETRLQKVWTEDFRRTGTYHALVISGVHLTTLAACLLFFLRVCALGRNWSLALTAAAGWMYAFVAGAETPVTRAAAGLTMFLMASLFFRRPKLLNILAAVGIAFLLSDPDQLFDASFHLSFLSVAMIGAFAVPLLERIATPYARSLKHLGDPHSDHRHSPPAAAFRLEMRLLSETLHFVTRLPLRACGTILTGVGRVYFFLFSLLVVSAVLQLGLLLPMVMYFHRVSISGLSANLLVVPLTNTAVPVGFLAIATGWRAPAAATAWLLRTAHAVAEWHAAIDPDWRVPSPPPWAAGLFLLALLAAAFSIGSGKRWRLTVSLAVFAICAGVIAFHPFAPQVPVQRLEVTMLDVGQGESLLVAAPDGQLMLIDGGGFPVFGQRSPTTLDSGEDIVSPYLWSRSIRRLDVVVATHGHGDHIGGLPAIIDNMRPAELWIGVDLRDDGGWLALIAQAHKRGVRVVPRKAGDKIRWGGTELEVLSPGAGRRSSPRTRNNDSLVLRLHFGRTAFLLTGDIERDIENRLAGEGRLDRADVLKIPHHGSRSSTTERLVEMVRPSFAVVSNGYENVYRFPHRDVLDRLKAARVLVWRTDLDGSIRFRSDGRRLEVESARQNRTGLRPASLPD